MRVGALTDGRPAAPLSFRWQDCFMQSAEEEYFILFDLVKLDLQSFIPLVIPKLSTFALVLLTLLMGYFGLSFSPSISFS